MELVSPTQWFSLSSFKQDINRDEPSMLSLSNAFLTLKSPVAEQPFNFCKMLLLAAANTPTFLIFLLFKHLSMDNFLKLKSKCM